MKELQIHLLVSLRCCDSEQLSSPATGRKTMKEFRVELLSLCTAS